ncbi:MAG TPA: NAD(P)/FAD-dependent oxidoreductase [Thermomicrobiales bacterium]|nr:NAD(P)/FAD-dependent oxidoreductase [Thermomicrobiales bacterium]
MWDVIVVGARCAGATVALRFARSGRSVLLLDKSRAGSDTLSSHVLMPPAIAALDELGLLVDVEALGAPRVHTMLVEFGDRAYPGPVGGQHGFLMSVRRTTLDPLLVDHARRAGATYLAETRVDELVWGDGRVTGVGGRGPGGRLIDERARLVIGADGRHSVVARKVAAEEYNVLVCESGAFYAYLQGLGPTVAGEDAVQFASGPECDILCCPCNEDAHMILLSVSGDEFTDLLAAGSAGFDARIQTVPTLAPRLSGARRVSKVYSATPRELRGFFRHPYGPGWALAGDAGYYAHPASANGIADAFRASRYIHELVERAWVEGSPSETYLDEYRATRDEESIGPYHFSYRLGKVNPFSDPEIAAAVTGQ